MNLDRILGLLLGLLAGVLLCGACSAAGFALGNRAAPEPGAPVPAPQGFTLDAAVDEAYLSRTMADNAKGFPSPWPVTSGQMDVQPGNQAVFQVVLQSPFGPAGVTGRVLFGAQSGELRIRIVDVMFGSLPVSGIMGLFAPGLDAQVTAQANAQLRERAGGAGVTLLGVTTDDRLLRLYFTGE